MGSATYYNAAEQILKGAYDFSSDTLKLILLNTSYTPDRSAHSTYSDISGYEATGTGYTVGGITLTNQTWSRSGDYFYLDADDVSLYSATLTAKYAAIYDDTSTNDDLLCYYEFDAVEEVTGGDMGIIFPALGFLKMSIGANVYRKAIEEIGKGTFDFESAALKVMLLGSGYTFSQDHESYSDVSSELAGSGGYTVGGTTLYNLEVSPTSNYASVLSSNGFWEDLTASEAVASAVIYDATTQYLLYYTELSGDSATTGNSYVVELPVGGIINAYTTTGG